MTCNLGSENGAHEPDMSQLSAGQGSHKAVATAPAGGQYTFDWLLAQTKANAPPPRTPVLEDERAEFTQTRLVDAIHHLKRELSLHLEPGTRVCALLPSGASFLVAQAAVVGIGGCFIAVPSDAGHLTGPTAAAIAADWLLVDSEGDGDVHQAAHQNGVGVLSLDQRTLKLEVLRRQPRPVSRPRADHAALGVVTSGSTGVPKVVAMSEDTYCHCAYTVAQLLSLGTPDRLMHTLPIQRGAGWLCWAGIAAGTRNRIQTVRSDDLAEALRSWDATGTFTVSTGVYALAAGGEDRSTLPRLRSLYYSSGPVTRALKEDLTDRFGSVLVQDYGMTEVPEPLTVFSREDHAQGSAHPALGSVGRPIHRGQVALAEPATADAPAVIRVRSPWMFSGYWRNGAVEPPPLRDGWVTTDDLGYFDVNGYLYLTGRTSATVRGGGVAFRLSEVLNLVRAAPGVIDARVRIVEDDRLGERTVADVVLAGESPPDAATFRERLKRIAPDVRMVPSQISFVSDLESEPSTDKDTV